VNARPATDVSDSIAAAEFVWSTDEHTEVHRFVANPIVDRLRRHKAETVLDLGCGNGSLTAYFARHGFAITGLDHSRTGIDLATRRYPETRFARHDLADALPKQHVKRYDAVVSVEVIEHLLLPRKLLESARNALRPGGLLIISTPYHGYWKNLALALTNRFDAHWHPLRDYGHVKFFSRRTLSQLISEEGFTDLDYSTVGRIPALARSMIVSAKSSL
jgi:2-polyprenyl-3-methyl-5-hydroxy-6-metoxy-1,4-benzoquinol methylase